MSVRWSQHLATEPCVLMRIPYGVQVHKVQLDVLAPKKRRKEKLRSLLERLIVCRSLFTVKRWWACPTIMATDKQVGREVDGRTAQQGGVESGTVRRDGQFKDSGDSIWRDRNDERIDGGKRKNCWQDFARFRQNSWKAPCPQYLGKRHFLLWCWKYEKQWRGTILTHSPHHLWTSTIALPHSCPPFPKKEEINYPCTKCMHGGVTVSVCVLTFGEKEGHQLF